ncbi:MAG TPA: molybdate ABC transporter substrate-binding protein, partial [Phenylobacterium sp.]|nr:molybdate ABC transporter substrate-binding protein [Phenylobacterium sp.]
VSGRLAQAENVRTALQYVARGEAPLGIVYDTDAKVEPGVRIVGVFPAASHPAIVYPAAVVAGSKSPDAGTFLAFLSGPEARAVFRKYGFAIPPRR